MSIPPDLATLPTWMGEAFAEHGFTELTPIQRAVLADGVAERDLRVASATGSGKTVAVAMAVAAEVERVCAADPDSRPPGAAILVIAPTRELATQLRGELQWIYGALRARVALVLGGGAYGPELRSLRRQPTILVGTPGRMLDHVKQGNADLSHVQTVVLDEADQLLELGFKAELDAILGACPKERRTLLVSATFSAPVRALADRHQRNALVLQGTPTGGRHADITHFVHPISSRDQLAALTNILLSAPEGRCLVFVAMRAQAGDIAATLVERGFEAAPLSGEMSQAERTRTLDRFRSGSVQILVGTDVAARGIDVQEIRTVVHACPPRDAEALIHRSGRTGRAGLPGVSILMATPKDLHLVRRVLSQARVDAKWEPVPGHDEVRALLDDRLYEELGATEDQTPSKHAQDLAQRLLEDNDPHALVARLIERTQDTGGCQPQRVETVRPPSPAERPRPGFGRPRPQQQQSQHASQQRHTPQRHGRQPPRRRPGSVAAR